MKTKSSFPAIFISNIFLLFFVYQAPLSAKPHVEELIKTGISWDGGAFSYPQGKAELIIVKVRLDEGEGTPLHCHAVPTAGYIFDGKLQVTLQTGESKVFEKGQVLVEVMRNLHKGKAIEGPVELVVFYAGAKGVSHTDLEDSKNCIAKPK